VFANLPSKARHTETLANAFDPRRNAFGLFRFALAALVIVSHCYPLGGFGRDPLEVVTAGRLSLGLFAVAMFFVLSGFLITRSASRTSAVRFLWHRFLRIFPGYWVCLVVSAFILAPMICQVEYTHAYRIFAAPHDSPQLYLAGNFAMLHLNHWSISGVMNVSPQSIGKTLHLNPYPFVFNGSIWTLPYELICYLTVGLLAVVGVVRRARHVVLLLFVAGWALYASNWLVPSLFHHLLPFRCMAELLMLVTYFFAGAVCFLYREKIAFSAALLGVSAIALACALPNRWFGIVAPITVPYLFLWFATKVPFHRFDTHRDYSYGLYIYAFPVQQALAFFRIQGEGFAIYLASALLLSTLFAIFSYHLIEAPCLRLKNIDLHAVNAKLRARRRGIDITAPALDSSAL
jgi:peptidoglycan/LPS O-acetylase OafA/YrhL